MPGLSDIPRGAARLVGVAGDALQALGRLEDLLDEGWVRLEGRLASVDTTTESLKPLLVGNQQAVERLEPRLEEMLAELADAREGIRELQRNLEEIREVVDPLRDTTERVARINRRLPGRT